MVPTSMFDQQSSIRIKIHANEFENFIGFEIMAKQMSFFNQICICIRYNLKQFTTNINVVSFLSKKHTQNDKQIFKCSVICTHIHSSPSIALSNWWHARYEILIVILTQNEYMLHTRFSLCPCRDCFLIEC